MSPPFYGWGVTTKKNSLAVYKQRKKGRGYLFQRGRKKLLHSIITCVRQNQETLISTYKSKKF